MFICATSCYNLAFETLKNKSTSSSVGSQRIMLNYGSDLRSISMEELFFNTEFLLRAWTSLADLPFIMFHLPLTQ